MLRAVAASGAAAVVAALCATALFAPAGALARSECDGQPDGSYCFGARWVWCENGDVVTRISCVSNCSVEVPVGSGARPRAKCAQTSRCAARPRYGTYCDGANTLRRCGVDGSERSAECADGCVERPLWAYCYVPPKCSRLSDTAAAGLDFCPRPDYEMDTALADDAAMVAELDDSAREVFADLTDSANVRAASNKCEFSAFKLACATTLPECETNEECIEKCNTFNECGTYFLDKNRSFYEFDPLDCREQCSLDSGYMVTPILAIVLVAIALLI